MAITTVPEWMENLEEEDLVFIKKFVLYSGSLKKLAESYEVTYPTVRLRLDKLIDKIRAQEQEETAPYVKLIKKLALEDRIDFEAAKILTPTAYFNSIGRATRNPVPVNPYLWASDAVKHILENRQYTGCAVTFKSTTVSFKVHKKIYNPAEEQQIIPNMQEPIISEELFDRVQELRSHKRRNTKTGRKSLFAGLLYCPDCGAKLHFCAAKSLKLNQEFYRCANYNSGRGTCDIHYIRNVVLEQIVAEAVGSLADFVRCYESVFLYLLAKNNNVARQSEVQKLKQSLATSERRIKMIDKAIEELFEARKPKGLAIITEFGGVANIKDTKKKREIIVTDPETGNSKTYLIPYGSRIKVQDGVYLDAGDELTEGSVNPHDILRIKGVNAVQDYMLREVQRVYRLQGVDIADKHIEVLVRQMLKKVRIENNGDTEFLPGTLVDVLDFEEMNEKLTAEGKEPAEGKRIILGITKAALATESFLSAASFQETTKVLTEAAIKGKVDNLIGLKENVIIGKLIPVGTGMKRYRNTRLSTDAVETIDFGGDMYGDDAELNLSDGSELDAEGAELNEDVNTEAETVEVGTDADNQ